MLLNPISHEKRMNKEETRQLLDELKEIVEIKNNDSKKFLNIVKNWIRGRQLVTSYHLYISYGNYHDLNDKNENLNSNLPFSIPLEALITRADYRDGPYDNYLAEINVDDKNLKVKLHKNYDSNEINIWLKHIALRHDLNMEVENVKKFKKHKLEMPSADYFDVSYSKSQ